jgi:Tol biopolymer transport system component
MNFFVYFLFVCICAGFVSCNKNRGENIPPVIPIDTGNKKPEVVQGKLVYHTYSCYSCNDSRLYLYDFGAKQLSFLSKGWDISNPMNAHFSPDGKRIVFMGTLINQNDWNIFMYPIGSDSAPVNLTKGITGRNEDPKFSPDGTKIVFKHNGILHDMDTTGAIIQSFELPQDEASMPYYTSDGSGILYAGSETGGSSTLDISLLSISTGTSRFISSIPFVEEYYPVSRDDTSFLFTRWNDQTNRNDQVYMGFYDERTPLRLPFNKPNDNYSDAYPVNDSILVLSSTRLGGRGQYDLYLADLNSGKVWSMNAFNSYINTVESELGACYTSK